MGARTYIAIDLKSFYASVECMERGLDPLTTHLVVADVSRTEKTICLAVSPSLKAYGLPGRARLFEVVQAMREVNAQRRLDAPGHYLRGSSYDSVVLMDDPNLEATYIAAKPRMSHYLDCSSKIYNIYLRYIAPQDIHVYSIDEVFIDATGYLKMHGVTAHELAKCMIQDVSAETGITATAGIGSNMYLAKVAMDVLAKHVTADEDGVRIAQLDEASYRRIMWGHTPITDFWRIGKGTAKKLSSYGMETMGDIARCSLGGMNDFYNEDLLYRMFGVNAELLIDHAWGWEPCTIEDIKEYHPTASSISSGQVLQSPYAADRARLVVREMADQLSLDLVTKGLETNRISLFIGYDRSVLNSTKADGSSYAGPVTNDWYGRVAPKPSSGDLGLEEYTSSTTHIIDAMMRLYDRIINADLPVRRINMAALGVRQAVSSTDTERYEQPDIFSVDDAAIEARQQSQIRNARERHVQEALLDVKRKFGKNAVVKAMNMEEGATGMQRNAQIGGHAA
ncbi:hypothetical protein [Bifidobacterium tsurumiense]|uniref:ImpB/MucB/SamB family protein n=1 Tax=Bifidobacterium tsurumiense TaxID=356829 RepID=A0A087EKS9_9BIFI|nr:hypothetical protein [Bifidobacterium tsurumiense]KFJ08380.1 ImpB/MucB/SamB family protein [Bifidobacterium tsurumiense]